MPRSGTKLLKGLLTQHPRIRIAQRETEFLPFLDRSIGRYGDLADPKRFARFYQAMTRLPYFMYCRRAGCLIGSQEWYEACRGRYDAASVFEALVRHDTGALAGTEYVWGDKSPSLIRHIPLILQLFPSARIVHIYRDVRDYCLSIRNAWGKDILRAAQRWRTDVSNAMDVCEQFPEQCLQIRYEDLLEAGERQLRAVCSFLGVEFVDGMHRLSHSVENLGRARGVAGILKDNRNKFLREMSSREVATVEAIAGPVLERCGYQRVAPVGNTITLSRCSLFRRQLMDGFNLVRREIASRGLWGSLLFYSRYFRISGNRF